MHTGIYYICITFYDLKSWFQLKLSIGARSLGIMLTYIDPFNNLLRAICTQKHLSPCGFLFSCDCITINKLRTSNDLIDSNS